MSAQAIRSPSLLKYMPLDLPDFSVKVLSAPEAWDHLIILLLGWSVKNTFPSLSTAGPSVKPNPSPSFSTWAPFATRFLLSSIWAVPIYGNSRQQAMLIIQIPSDAALWDGSSARL